jgi:putative ABC transport system permease protein
MQQAATGATPEPVSTANPTRGLSGLRLALRLAGRELRGGLSGFRIFLMCLILGITTIAAVGSLSASLVAGMAAQGQNILGADVDFRLVHRAAFDSEKAWLEGQGSLSQVATMRAMVRKDNALAEAGDTMLVEAKSVDAAYPLYGSLTLAPALPLSQALAVEREGEAKIYGAVAEQGLFDRLGIEPGAVVLMGDIRLRLKAVVVDEPDRTAGGFPLAPRLMLSHDTLRAAGLLQPGSLINYHYRLKLPPQAESDVYGRLRAEAGELFPDAGWRIRDRSDASPSLRRFIERLGLFLTLVGLTALVVGGVGVGNAITAYVQKRSESIAIMRALGASGRFIFYVYAMQIAALTLFGVIVGLLLGGLTPWAIKVFFGPLLPVEIIPQLYPQPLLAASGFGILSAAAFALWPLGLIEKTPVTALFRNQIGDIKGRPSRRVMLFILLCFAGLAALALLISERRDVAIWFGIGVGLSYLAFAAAARLIVWLARRAGRPRQPELRMALSNIIRPNAPVRAVMLSMGLSVTLLSAISMVDGNINQQIGNDLPERTPSFFFLDIQPHQIDDFLSMARTNTAVSRVETSPFLRGQILAINDVPSAELTPPPEAAWVLRGDRGLTYSQTPPQGGELVEGAWWAADYDGPPLISFDVDLAVALGIGIGDTVRVNILGRPLTGTIANLRKVDWASGGMNFVMVFSPAPLSSAPHTHLTTVTMAAAQESGFARDVAIAYPNVTIIRVKEAIQAASSILTNIGLAVRAMSAITLIAGILVLAGAMASGHRARVYDAVVMKILGATRRRIMAAYAIEYALMGFGAALIAAAAGTLASWGLVAGAMQANWVFLPVTLGLTIIGAVVLTVVLGLIGTYAALSAPAAPVLRSE